MRLVHQMKQKVGSKAEVDVEVVYCRDAFNRDFTVRLHVMQRTILLSQFCLSVRPSVCPSVRLVHYDKTK